MIPDDLNQALDQPGLMLCVVLLVVDLRGRGTDSLHGGHSAIVVLVGLQELAEDQVTLDLVEMLANQGDYMSKHSQAVNLQFCELIRLVSSDGGILRVRV